MDKLEKLELKQRIEYQEKNMQDWGMKTIKHIEEVDNMVEELSETSDEEVERLALEDTTALECLVQRHISIGDYMTALPFLLKGLRKNSRHCSETIEMLVDAKLITLEENDMLLFLALQEQALYHKYYKLLSCLSEDKLEKLNSQVFNSALYNAMLEGCAQINKGASITVKVERATKSVPVKVYEKTYIISLSYDNNFLNYGIYFYFDHNKKTNESATINAIKRLLENGAENVIKQFKPASLVFDVLNEKIVKISSKESANKQAFYEATGNIKSENVNIKVEKTEGGALSLNACGQCGRGLDKDGNCKYCGATKSETLKNNSHIDRNGNFVLNVRESENGELQILSCTQCASPISTNASDGENVVCPSCGASFILNKNAFTLTSGGIIRKQMEQDKPKNEEFPTATFAVRPLYKGRLGITIPEEFTIMDTKMKAIKYPRGNPPELVLTDERGAINYTFSPMHNASAGENEISAVSQSVLGALRKMMPSAAVGETGIITSGKHNVSFFELITPANEDIYNLMLHFNLSGTLMTASFNCLARERWFWAPVFLLAAKSIKFDD